MERTPILGVVTHAEEARLYPMCCVSALRATYGTTGKVLIAARYGGILYLMRQPVVQSVILFVGLVLAAAALVIATPSLSDPYARTVLPVFAAALFASGLTVFLLRVTSAVTPQHS